MSSKLVYLIIGAILLVGVGFIALSLPAKNTNPVQKLKEAATPIPIPTIPPGTLFVTSDGVAPMQINVKIGNALKIVNNTGNDVTIKMSGKLTNDLLIPAKKTLSTDALNGAGQIKAWLSNNIANVVVVTVN